MHVALLEPPPLKPDDILLWLIEQQFTKGVIFYLVTAFFIITAWIGFGKKALEIGKGIGDTTGGIIQRLKQKPKAYRMLILVATGALLAVELFWMYVAFMGGNILSFAFGERETTIFSLAFDNGSADVGPLQLDNISALYLALAVVCLFLASRAELRLDDKIVPFYGTLAGAPALYWGVPTTFVVALDTASMLWLDGKEFLPDDMIAPAIIAGTSLAYLLTCWIAVYAAVLLTRLWRSARQLYSGSPGGTLPDSPYSNWTP
ncbi:hypothetical protein FXN61_00340 [Lentzea sp. PSKA42]|uniref:Uncharacterized protein n=1 Tax=Lentzea indica TaxID=2604800 RepID=A0ABX1F970_9PSEU|nr:hypothetical protein [Lentzea indica]NKE55355.1 hypothetical protein [Lentzea indica]